MKIPNMGDAESCRHLSLARIVSEDSQPAFVHGETWISLARIVSEDSQRGREIVADIGKSSKDS